MENIVKIIKNPYSEQKPYSVIVPCFNEEEGIGTVLEELFKNLDKNYQIIVVDDGSVDDTLKNSQSFECMVVKHTQNMGKGEALKTGIKLSDGRYICWIDADGTYPAVYIPQLVFMMENEGYDLVYGVRNMKNIPHLNRLGNKTGTFLMRVLHQSNIMDPCCGLCGTGKWIKNTSLRSPGFGIEVEVAAKAAALGLKTGNLPIEYRERKGKSKLHPLKDGLRISATILSEFCKR